MSSKQCKSVVNLLVVYTAQSEDDDVAQKFIDVLEDDIKQIYTEYQATQASVSAGVCCPHM